MNPGDFDKILLSDRQVEPSGFFAREVMLRVEAEASCRRPFPFPWVRFAAIMLAGSILAAWLFPADAFLRAGQSISSAIGNWIVAPHDLALRNALVSLSASLAGTLLLVWFSLRLAGANR
jgi:hypothetical protein